MVSLSQIEQDLSTAMKAKDQIAVDVLRGLKTRLQNEKIAKLKDLSEEDVINLVKSEIKRRKEAAESFAKGGRAEMAAKETQEAEILSKYLPPQMSEAQIAAAVDEIIGEMKPSAQDFGKVMGALKSKLGNSADGAIIAKLLKEKLK